MDELAQKAITAALNGNWGKALEINVEILKKKPKNIDALNRLAKAYCELGNIPKAKSIAKNVLKIDPYNKIAQKSFEKWKDQKSAKTNGKDTFPVKAQTFLEEPGKTKIVKLINLGDPVSISSLDAGDCLEMTQNTHRVNLKDENGKYIGRLPDDLAAHLKKLIRIGNEYKVFVKSVSGEEVKVFIKETKRAEKLQNIPSFSSEKIHYVAFTSPELIRKKESILSEEVNEES